MLFDCDQSEAGQTETHTHTQSEKAFRCLAPKLKQ